MRHEIVYTASGYWATVLMSLGLLAVAAENWMLASRTFFQRGQLRYPWESRPAPWWSYLAGGMLWYTCGVIWLYSTLSNLPNLVFASLPFFLALRWLHPPKLRPYLQ